MLFPFCQYLPEEMQSFCLVALSTMGSSVQLYIFGIVFWLAKKSKLRCLTTSNSESLINKEEDSTWWDSLLVFKSVLTVQQVFIYYLIEVQSVSKKNFKILNFRTICFDTWKFVHWVYDGEWNESGVYNIKCTRKEDEGKEEDSYFLSRG